MALASRILPHHPRCLAQALAVRWILSGLGTPSTLKLGVAYSDEADVDDRLEAHAWVVVGDRIVVGAKVSEKFTELASFQLGSSRRSGEE